MDCLARTIYRVRASNAISVFFDLGHGGNGYNSCMVGPYGVRVYYTKMRSDVHVVVPGGACDIAESVGLLGLFELRETTFKRIDIALDGVLRDGRPVDPIRLFHDALYEPLGFRTRVRLSAKAHPVTGRYPENARLMASRNGSTFYLGSSKSQSMMRVYDSRGFARIEMQYRDDKAAALRDMFEGARAGKLSETILGLIRDHVDFVDPDPRFCRHREKAPLQPWWDTVVGFVDKVRPYVPVDSPQLDRSFRHFRLQWSTFLASAFSACGGDMELLERICAEGSQRLTAKHHRMIEEVGGPGGWVPQWN
jgi:hypothetical protein